jgi:predicted ATPase
MKLDKLHINEFQNLKDVTIDFDEESLSTVLVGKNGTGKSNLLEAIALIFCNLDLQKSPSFKYKLEYQIREKKIRIDADPKRKHGKTHVTVIEQKMSQDGKIISVEVRKPFKSLVENSRQYLPNNIFGYYSGEVERFPFIFEKHLKDYTKKIKNESFGFPLRSLFLVESHYSQFVLLTLFSLGDSDSIRFLKERFGIVGLDSVEFQFKHPYWSKQKTYSFDNSWGDKETFEKFLENLQDISIKNNEESSLKVKNVSLLRSFGDKYQTRSILFKIFESIFISNLLIKLKMSVKKAGIRDGIEFDRLSEGEQQVLLIIGLLKFMNEKESLFLLDEPETHLNPDWRYNFLSSLEEEFKDKEKSHIIIATHDPLLVGSLTKKQVQVFSYEGEKIVVKPPFDDPLGLGVDGILTSDLFGLRTTIDQATQKDIDRRNELVIKKTRGEEALSPEELNELEKIDSSLAKLGFIGSARDPMYSQFLMELRKFEEKQNLDFEKLERSEQAELVKKAMAEIQARRAKHEIS